MAARSGRTSLRPVRSTAELVAFIGVGLLVAIALGRAASLFYTDALWYQALDHSRLFWTRFTTVLTVRLVTSAFAAALILLNLWFVLRQLGPVHLRRRYGNLEIAEQVPRTMLLAGALAIAVLAGWWLSSMQFSRNAAVAVLAWLRQVRWDVSDPVFGNDLSFYIFSLPIYTRIVDFLLIVVLWSMTLVAIGYVLVGAVRVRAARWDIDERPRVHFATLVAGALVILGARVFLSRYQLLLEGTGFNDALGYTDVHARLPARLAISVLLAVSGAAVLYGVVRRAWVPPLLTLGLLFLAVVGMGVAYPAFVQSVQVEPNQLAREVEYIRWNLEFTRRAYGLDRIERRQLPYRRANANVWAQLAPTLQGLPLWDAGQLQTAFNEIQSLYRYYHFQDVDFDRYGTGAARRQVAVAVREFTPEGLTEGTRTWQTLHMNPAYIRGMGVVVSPAAEKQRGDPVYWLNDIQPVQRDAAAPAALDLREPSVYFGETMDEYAIVGYSGSFVRADDGVAGQSIAVPQVTTGIPLGSFARVLSFAWRFAEPNLLLTGELADSTRLIFRRNVVARAELLAPFLVWDRDVLPVVLDGRVVWLLDGYSASPAYPLARAVTIADRGTVRYLRSSVKATVDGVTGAVRMYALPDADPIVRTYRSIFPKLIEDWDAMPEAVREHLRYPPLLFQEQTNMLDEYHLEQPQEFFAGQDMWQLPPDVPNQQRRTRPDYVLAALPGGGEPEFLLVQPFIARQRQNMTALLVARSDAPHYGELVLLQMSRDDQIKGPTQVDAIMEADPAISRELALYRQRGSTVALGQLRILATDSSIVYIRPVFLSAEDRGIPQLQRVVVTDGTVVSMAEDLGAAIAGLGADVVIAPRPGMAQPVQPAADDSWRQRALELMREAESRLRAGDFAGFGAAWTQLRILLEQRSEGGNPR